MRQPGFSLFPFLSVQLGAMGVLSFLAAVLALLQTSGAASPRIQAEIQLVGAPPYVRPLLLECRKEVLWLHASKGIPSQRFSVEELRTEVNTLNILIERIVQELGPTTSRDQVWLTLKRLIPQQPSFQQGFVAWLHQLELSNLSGENRAERIQQYPILLVRTNGIDTYELASQLLEQSTRLAIGVEPLPPDWEIPYQEFQPNVQSNAYLLSPQTTP